MLKDIPMTILSVVCVALLVIIVFAGIDNRNLNKTINKMKTEENKQLEDARIAKEELEDRLYEALNKEVETVVVNNLKETVRVEYVEKKIEQDMKDNPVVFTNQCLTITTANSINDLIAEKDN